jgi:ABC-type branched-subunit amino acid transport system ATPase component
MARQRGNREAGGSMTAAPVTSPRVPAPPALAVREVGKKFGGVEAVRDVSLTVAPGQVLGVIGPNGSGKTTLINLLTGVYRADRGSIQVAGRETSRLRASRVAGLGVARTFQNPHVFATLTVRQNLLMALRHSVRAGRQAGRSEAGDIDRWLGLTGLADKADHVASELSGGQRKLVEFARAMARRPSLVLMDEPFAGVYPAVKRVLHDRIRQLAASGETAFLIVSHEIPDLIDLSDQFICMAAGAVLKAGDPAEVCRDEAVIDAYLGASHPVLRNGAA